MGDSQCPFAGSALGPSTLPPSALEYTPGGSTIAIAIPGEFVSPLTGVPGEFTVTNGGAPPNPVDVELLSGKIRLSHIVWLGITLLTLTYVPGPIPWLSSHNQALQAFSLPLPYP